MSIVMSKAARNEPDIIADITALIPTLRRYARALVRNAVDADDLVQDCLLRALSRRDHFQSGTNLKAWMISILHNIFIDGTRTAKRRNEFVRAIALSQEGNAVTRPNQVMRLELLDIEKALALLPPTQRSTLLMISLEGMSYEQVSKATNVPIGTVRSRLSRSRANITRLVHGVDPGERRSGQQDLDQQISLAS